VASRHRLRWARASRAFFAALAEEPGSSVRLQRHYELFEDPSVSDPDYRDVVPGFRRLSPDAVREAGAPVRDGCRPTGWCVSTYFCEAPIYLRFLEAAFQRLGGSVYIASELPDPPSLASYLAGEHRVYVLCAGEASGMLLRECLSSSEWKDLPGDGFVSALDPLGVRLIRGLYLTVPLSEPLYDHDGGAFSYNYTPDRSAYPAVGDNRSDVYCYPRRVGWLLGGSREIGQIDSQGRWRGPAAPVHHISVGAERGTIRVPEPILSLNAALLRSTPLGPEATDVFTAPRMSRFKAGCGFRFVRDSDSEQVRLEASRLRGKADKFIVHNYGHGGAGFTLSWGCAVDVLSAVRFVSQRDISASPSSEDALPNALRAAAARFMSDEGPPNAAGPVMIGPGR
jgi:D-amino-acid oxidase